jgi:hypothetical protein
VITSPEKYGATTSISFSCLKIAIKKLPAARRVEYRVEPVVLEELPPPRILSAGAPVARRAQAYFYKALSGRQGIVAPWSFGQQLR